MSDHVVYAIKRNDGGYVDKGGRKTHSIPQMFFWNDKEAAQKYLDAEHSKIWIPPDATFTGFKVVPVTITLS